MAPITFGVLMIPVQLTDIAGPLDILAVGSTDYLKGVGAFDPEYAELAKRAMDIDSFVYVGETRDKVTCTASFPVYPTHTIDDCPKLDYLLIGGLDPSFIGNLSEPLKQFIRDRTKDCKIVFTTCVGAIVLAMTGVLDGKEATTNHQLIPLAQQMAPNVKWTKEKQWIISGEGKFWTSGGAYAGTDMVAHWVSENYGQDVGEAGWILLDYEPRDINGRLVPLKKGLRVNGA